MTEVQWPSSDSCNIECGPEGEISVCSLDGHAKLILSSSGEEFTVEFTCRSSQSEADTQYQQLQGIQHRSTCLLSNLSSAKNVKNFSDVSEDSRTHRPKDAESATSRNLYTRVIQQFSRASYPQTWHYPLSLAVGHLESQKTKRTAGQHGANHVDVQDRHAQTSKLPHALPVKCPSPHQHR